MVNPLAEALLPGTNLDAPIGVFDSGVGGLSVLRAIHSELPQEDLLYIADSGHAPYGDRDPEFIQERTECIARQLLDAGAKAIVMACNTATVVAAGKLRSWCPVPIVAIEPAIKPAAQVTKSGVIAVLATRRTLASPNVARLCAAYGTDVDIRLQACPGLVEQVEKADLESSYTRTLLESYLVPLLAAGADTFVLGCTHYPFLTSLIREITGSHATIIDPATAVAKELIRRLNGKRIVEPRQGPVSVRFISSADCDEASTVISALWGYCVNVEPIRTSLSSRLAALG